MNVSENVTGTLRSQMNNHQPLVLSSQQGGADIGVGVCPTITAAAGTSGNNQPVLFDNHAQDSRYDGPLDVSPTVLAAYGTGGNRTPLVKQNTNDDALKIVHCPLSIVNCYCLAGNIIGREEKNGGNGFGYQSDVSYTLNCTDRHAVYNRRGYSDFNENEVAGTQCARQYKDATDLVCENTIYGQSQFANYREGCSTLRAQGGDQGGGSENLVTNANADPKNLIRRLTPLECERLQGFADGWTDIPGASDSKRYKALGNSVAIPCVNYIMQGISAVAIS